MKTSWDQSSTLRLGSAAAAATEKFDVSPKTFCEVEEMIMDLSIRSGSTDLFHALIQLDEGVKDSIQRKTFIHNRGNFRLSYSHLNRYPFEV